MAGKENLRDVLTSTPRETAKQIKRVAELLASDQSDPSSPEVVAAFKVMEGLSSAGVKIGEALQGILFEESEVVEGVTEPISIRTSETDGVARDQERHEDLRTFGELLRARIDDALPVDDRIQRTDLATLLQNEVGVRKASTSLGLSSSTFDRSEAITVAEKVLTTPGPHFEPRISYPRTELFQRFGQGFGFNAATLDGWSQLIGYDWKANPNVDLQTALAIRGLIQLQKITTAPKRS